MSERLNCWQVLGCNNEQNCPAFPEHGRNCFAVTATLCRGETQGTYDEKIAKCRKGCKFFQDMMDGSV
ncbi:two-CW domain-containing protein [Desulfomonile tiedjei]|uniref:Uncharacterized protein n=1 Tax=Desulfomonile tiedjei (strain ATCC 49306 / DSM 6799 / DCB-1) TaxID=706587 RepID=I4C9M0_DESTA|nr:hypothetical protein Desti_3613 [Desulfomonile tiedjei DSM 6799]